MVTMNRRCENAGSGFLRILGSRFLTIDQLEDVVVDKVLARGVLKELEGLAVVHGALLLVDL